MYKRLDGTLARDGWDTLFIGSGPGSLTCAAVLARAGQRVIVLEKHYEAGGFSHTFRRKGFEWDVGVHYIGGVHREGSVERRAFDYISERRLEWAYMDSPYDRAIIDGKTYDFVPGSEEQIAKWIGYFPGEEDAIRKYWALVRECASSSQSFFADRAVPPLVSTVAGPFMRRKFQRFADQTTYEVLRGLTANETLITMLCAQCGDYGLPPNASSFAIHAMVVNHYRGGGNYPVGGAAQIAHSIVETIERRGGAVVLRAGVEEILLESGKAVGVRLEDGQELRARNIVSGAGVRNTCTRLLPPDARVPNASAEDLKQVKPSLGHLCLYVGLERSDAALDLPKFNYWCYDPYVGDGTPGGRVPTAYISFSSAKDPAWPERHPGKATIQCIGPAHFAEFAPWADLRWRKRGEEYEAVKDAFQERMLDTLFRLHPECRGHVAWAEVSTPLSTAHFANYASGEIYGLEHTPARFRLKWLRPRTPIPRLYLTGQDICTAGVAGALMSGLMTASAMLGKNMIAEIMKGAAP
ncbi:MAG: NAD(P)/FAD-dependent oxidoreductase [Candidatus Hydrogenedentes bacterium]|nr:NAD(P)/FAD-dependent oxidoreductase [Candidatus Hydrogenedentota bacterium]